MNESEARIAVEIAPLPPALAGPAMLRVGVGCRVADVLELLGLEIPPGCVVGVWGRVVEPSAFLGDGDRVEIYRPLAADPKSARRARVPAAAPARGRPRSEPG